ncbi:chorismate mutase AroH [Heyndrickxia sporothermodurans]|nr:chorismate mutase AroH [Heyndrickxia sporothermodurans]
MIRGLRGATTVTQNIEMDIIHSTEELIKTMISQNDVEATDVASVFISVTPDINATFPAKALRRIPNWTYVPVMCMKEIDVDGSLPFCIRVMMHIHTNKEQHQMNHVYLKDTTVLRPELQKNKLVGDLNEVE